MSKDEATHSTATTDNKSTAWQLYKWFALSVFTLFSVSVILTVLYRVVPIPATPLMVIRTIEQWSEKNRDLRWLKNWEPRSDIAPALQLAVVCAEDQAFLTHQGFDFTAIEKAVKHNKRSRRKRGASTISQQTAKNVFLFPNRSWLRKGLEVYFTLLIEAFWSKKRIMEVYLNVIEFGDGIYGAEAAAQYFFKKPAANLKNNEAALLAAVLPNPLHFRASPPSAYVNKRKNWILRQMEQWNLKLEW